MSKKRKTRKEKILTGLRKQNTSFESSSPTYSFDVSKSTSRPIPPIIPDAHSSTLSYAYVGKDVRRTFYVTSFLAGASMVLYLLMQNHIIRLTVFGY
ncbi:MAG: hypothetical protein ACM3IJ_02915 [Candidatus Levyibacteriota bacterium]